MTPQQRYAVFDTKLQFFTAVRISRIPAKDSDANIAVDEVLQEIQRKTMVVTYIEECICSEDVIFHKVQHKNDIFYLVETKRYSKLEFKPLNLSLITNRQVSA